jgi:hypothetical protein
VNIKFVPGTADDMECIALLDGEELFIFTTKDSLRPISEKEEIKGYID